MIVAGVALLAAGAAEAGQSARKAAKIVDKYIEAIGGERNVLKLKSLTCEGYMEQQGFQAKFKLYRQRPNRTRLEAKLGPKTVVQAFNGYEGWWTNPYGSMKPEPMPESVKQMIMPWIDFDGPLVRFERKGHHARYIAEEDLSSGGKAHHIELVLVGGDTWHFYIDSETYLEVMRTYEVAFQGQVREVKTHFIEYVEVEGVLLPKEIKGESVDGTSYRMIFTGYDAATDIDPDIFDAPKVEEGRLDSGDEMRLAGVTLER